MSREERSSGHETGGLPCWGLAWLPAALLFAAALGGVIAIAGFGLWLLVGETETSGGQVYWKLPIAGPFNSRWWNVWTWTTAMVTGVLLPKAIRLAIQDRRR